jgi:hypothetical protein
MGTRGPGNFDNDRALDIRDELLNRLEAGIERRLTPGPGVDNVERVMAEVALFTSVLRRVTGCGRLPGSAAGGRRRSSRRSTRASTRRSPSPA